MPAAKKKPKKKPAARARRSSSPRGLPALEQRQLDLIGLGLVGLGLFFGFLVYAGWEGGRVGSQAVEAPEVAARRRRTTSCRWRSSRRGAIVVLRPVLPAVRPFRSGAICLFLAVTPGAVGRDARPRAGGRAAGLVGRGVGQDARRHGGGDASTGGSRRCSAPSARTSSRSSCSSRACCCSRARPSRASIKFTSDSVSSTTRELRTAAAKAPRPRPSPRVRDDLATLERSTRVKVVDARRRRDRGAARVRLAVGLGDRGGRAARRAPFDPSPTREPEPERRTRRSRSPRSRRSPSSSALAEDQDEEGVMRGPAKPVDPEQLTPQGRYRPEVTDSPDFVWQVPDAARAHALDRGPVAPGHRRPGEGRRAAAGGARALQDRGQGHRHGGRPAHHPLRAAARARASRWARSRSSRTTSRTRWPRPTSASWRRSRASRPSASRCRTRAAGSCTSATSTGSRPRTGRRSPCGSARTSRAARSAPTSPRCRICSSPAPPARASPRA